MNTNPFETPKSQAALPAVTNVDRVAAQRGLRIALVLLLISAVYNFVCFSVLPSYVDEIDVQQLWFFRAVNFSGLVLFAMAVWFLGLIVLEFLTSGLHAIFGRRSSLASWQNELYRSLAGVPLKALLGAVLWAVWIAAFYQLDVNFFVISVPVGIAAHLLAAWVYLPLLYRWYKQSRTPLREVPV